MSRSKKHFNTFLLSFSAVSQTIYSNWVKCHYLKTMMFQDIFSVSMAPKPQGKPLHPISFHQRQLAAKMTKCQTFLSFSLRMPLPFWTRIWGGGGVLSNQMRLSTLSLKLWFNSVSLHPAKLVRTRVCHAPRAQTFLLPTFTTSLFSVTLSNPSTRFNRRHFTQKTYQSA